MDLVSRGFGRELYTIQVDWLAPLLRSGQVQTGRLPLWAKDGHIGLHPDADNFNRQVSDNASFEELPPSGELIYHARCVLLRSRCLHEQEGLRSGQ
jgi:hypothetical protein